MKRSGYIFKVFVKIFFQDKFNLFMIFFFNAFLMVIFGLTMQDKYNINIDIGLLDCRNDSLSISTKSYIKNQPNFILKTYNSKPEILNEVKMGKLVAGIIIEPKNGNDALQINVFADPTREMWLKFLEPALKIAVMEPFNKNKVEIKTQFVQSNNLRFFDFIFPGLLIFSIMQIGLSGAIMLLMQRENESLKRLQVTPLKKREFLFGYSSAYFFIMILLTTGYILIAKVLFNYMFIGSIINFLLMIIFSSVFFIVLGILMSNYVDRVENGNNFNRFFTFPASFLCGVFMPISTLPIFLQKIALIHPLTYMIEIMRGITNYNVSLSKYALTLTILFIIFIVALLASVYTFKWQEKK